MPTQNQYNPEQVDLNGGLDIVTPRLSVAPGALIDCYNYEIADHVGYRRMEGCERFDGRESISLVYTALVSAVWVPFTGTCPTPKIGDVMQFQTVFEGDTSIFWATITHADAQSGPGSAVLRFAVNIQEWLWIDLYSNPDPTNPLLFTLTDSTASGSVYAITQFGDIATGLDADVTVADTLATIGNDYGIIKDAVTTASSKFQYKIDSTPATYTATPNGLVFFKDQLYAARDLGGTSFDNGNSAIFPNDILVGETTGKHILVREVDVIQGSYAGGDATGIIWYTPQDKIAFIGGESYDIHRGASTVIVNALTQETSLNNTGTTLPPAAELLIANGITNLASGSNWTEQGWATIDTGYQYAFINGTSIGPPPPPGRSLTPAPASIITSDESFCTAALGHLSGRPPQLAGSSPTPPINSNDWQFNAGTFPDLLTHKNEGNWTAPDTAVVGHRSNTYLQMTGFTFADVPPDALITGIQVNINTFTTGSVSSLPYWQMDFSLAGSASKVSPPVTSTSSAATNSFTIGGSGDLWSIGSVSVSDLQGATLSIGGVWTTNPTPGDQMRLDYLSIQVFYQTSSSIYYFWNGTDDVKGVITNSTLTSGDWTTNDAAGIMQVTNITPVGTSIRSQIHANDQIWTAPGGVAGGGSQLALVNAEMTFAGLPTTAQIKSVSAQSEIKALNFYGNADWESIYGCNGYGRAWVYDSFYFRYIYTGLSDTLDKPRHLQFHSFCLVLGYLSGQTQLSVPGSPESFDGTFGALEIDFGDQITGLSRLSGTTLGIFCQKTIQALNGTDSTNFSVSMLNPYEGAIEYTVVDSGAKPIYCSYKGISTFDQTSAYGSFEGQRLSDSITPWLLPRIRGQRYTFPFVRNPPEADYYADIPDVDYNANNGILLAMPNRTKNQYRLWFKDGTILTMTLMGQQQQPQFTIQRINIATAFGEPDTGFSLNGAPVFLIPLAHSSGIDSTGVDRNHVSCDLAFTTQSLDDDSNPWTLDQEYVYELDRGWSFNGLPIQAYMTTTASFFDNPFVISKNRKIRVHGQSYGVASVGVQISNDYSARNFTYGRFSNKADWPAQDISLPRNDITSASGTFATPDNLTGDWQYVTNIANVANRGASFELQFSTAPLVPEPPHILQSLQFFIHEDKGNV